ncbi:hypothetical protein [Alkalicoccus daliensis]|uniref:Uncharacterized protein n=1 Tax=Alkalicoccus daliensis TaxID=745820 RepID=A0A1H0I167_9BACI|nr:hypothetical protein [Alkalicoccus daliensis]SDO25119.1 hypothetical protein SAMN04488053_109130 [Alkalicoccus daliensis]
MESITVLYIVAALFTAAGVSALLIYAVLMLRKKQKQLSQLQEQINDIEKKIEEKQKN